MQCLWEAQKKCIERMIVAYRTLPNLFSLIFSLFFSGLQLIKRKHIKIREMEKMMSTKDMESICDWKSLH